MIRFGILCFGIFCAVFAAACGDAEPTTGSLSASKSKADWSRAGLWSTFQGNNARTGYMAVMVDRRGIHASVVEIAHERSRGVLFIANSGGDLTAITVK